MGLFSGPFYLAVQDVWTNPPVRQQSRSDCWTPRPGRGGPERSGGRATVPGREQSHPLRHLIFESILRLESLRSFPTAKLLPNSGDFRGRITICVMRFDTVFTAEIANPKMQRAQRVFFPWIV
jgi:hypothetical protein